MYPLNLMLRIASQVPEFLADVTASREGDQTVIDAKLRAWVESQP